MNWEEYESKFINLARYRDKSEVYIEKCLNYGKALHERNLPIIYDQNHLSLLVGYKLEYLIKVSNSQEPFYREFKIRKKNKESFRSISEPLPNLKNIQKWILDEILSKVETNKYSKAYQKGVSIRDNAKFHRKQNILLSIDIENYFESINWRNVYLFFLEIGYIESVAVMLSNLTTLNNSLPQGAPTSPMLSNLTTQSIDEKISEYTNKNKIRYTRYADDLTFSGNFNTGDLLNRVQIILESQGFKINETKTRTRKRNQRQEVTGIIVNDKMQAPRNYRRELRQNIYYIKKFGLPEHMLINNIKDKKLYLQHLLGVSNFIININPQDKEVIEYYIFLKELYKSLE